MPKIAIAILLAAGLTLSPLPQLVAVAAAQTAPSAEATAKSKPKRAPTPGQIAARERQKKCAAEWRADKAAGKVEKGMKWPSYWSACNKKLKGAAG